MTAVNPTLSILALLVVGVASGGLAIWLVLREKLHFARREAAESELRADDLRSRIDEMRADESRLRDAFKSTASDVLSQSTTELLKVAEERFRALTKESNQQLESKKQLIDQNLTEMGGTLKGLMDKSTQLAEGLRFSYKQTEELRTTTEGLRQVLSNSQKRGKWGERMVEDVLQTIGFVEGINFLSQKRMSTGNVPDFTFLLPKGKVINMDVKFPIDQYEASLNAETDDARSAATKQFLTAVKNHIKDVAGRGYINPAEGTVDYVMIFIPNEAVYAFIHQSDPELLDFALDKHVVLCSPITLYAVLSLIRQAVHSFALEEQAGEVMGLLDQFWKQWGMYVGEMDKMGSALERARERYTALVNTRTTQLEKPLEKIRRLQSGQAQELKD